MNGDEEIEFRRMVQGLTEMEFREIIKITDSRLKLMGFEYKDDKFIPKDPVSFRKSSDKIFIEELRRFSMRNKIINDDTMKYVLGVIIGIIIGILFTHISLSGP